MYRVSGVLLFLLAYSLTTAQAEPATVALACKGAVIERDEITRYQKTRPVSMGIIVDFHRSHNSGLQYRWIARISRTNYSRRRCDNRIQWFRKRPA